MSDIYLDRIETERQHAAHRVKEIITRAEARAARTAKEERRAIRDGDYTLSPEEQGELGRANAAYDRYSDESKRIMGYRARTAPTDEYRASLQPFINDMREETAVGYDYQGFLHRAIASGETHIAFNSERNVGLGWENRALSVGAQGGTMVPTTFADFVVVYERALNPIIDYATVIPTRSGSPFTIPTLTADVTAGGTITAEAAGITQGDPTFGRVQLGAFKIAHSTVYSAELDQDEAINLDNILARAISRPIGIGWGSFFTLGTGTTQPNGWLTQATNGGTASGTATGTSSDTFYSPTDAVGLYYSLAPEYRNRGTWAVNTGVKLRQFKDANGNFMWQMGDLTRGQPDRFMGHEVMEVPAMSAAGSATKALAFGDFGAYTIRDVTPMRVDISRDFKFSTDELVIRVVTRRDGALADTAAIKYLVSANT